MHPKLTSVLDNQEMLSAEVSKEITLNILQCDAEYSKLPQHLSGFSLVLTDKSDAWNQRIHCLSFPTSDLSLIKGESQKTTA